MPKLKQPLSQLSDGGYIRLPDGRVLRAANTAAVRTHISSGRIPRDSRVCRGVGEEWVLLEWTPEFVDLVRPHEDPVQDVAPAAEPVVAPPAAPRSTLADTTLPVKKGPGVASRLDPL